ncbi:heavy metal-associated isoprenylated plant protein 5-like [Euphorbia lathyris]|uniref:heavy metal-associated isoprenylated plant protein 5-like n=1 Tax=Euphorbia lathyris TaxID=212925 RepID=UPI00331426A4
MVMEDLQDYLMIKALYAKSKLAFRKCSGDIDIAMEFVTQPHHTEGEGDKAAAATSDGGEKKDERKPVSVYKVDMHCEGCCKKHLEGVESAKTDCQSNKLTVTGEVDPEKVKARLEKKMKKEVQIVSPQQKKEAGGGGEKKADEKAAEKKPEVKKPPPEEITVVLKIRTHCDDCITKMKKIIRKIKGVESVAVDDRKDLVTVKWTMEVKDLVPYLSEKFRTSGEVVQPKTDEAKKEVGGDGDGGGGEKKTDAEKVDGEGEKKNDAQKVDRGGEEKKDDNKEGFGSKAGEKKSHGKKDEAGAGEKKNDDKKDEAGAGEKKNDDKKGDERGEEAKVKNKEAPAPAPAVTATATATAASGDVGAMPEVINKMDYYPAYFPTHWMDGIFAQSYIVYPQHPQYDYAYNPVNQGYQIPIYNNIEPVYNHLPVNPAQMFSDDNPHACSIM